MQITFWGVRALVPSPGQETTVTGGNTLCITVRGEAGEILVVDAGTGITPWGRSILSSGFGRGQGELDLFITHPHYDHIQGFPFFVPAFIPGNTIRLYGSTYCKRTMEQVLESQMNPIFSPIQSLKNLNSNLLFPEVEPGEVLHVGGLEVRLTTLPHVTEQAMGVQVREGSRTVVLAPDVNYPNGEFTPEAHAFFQDADLLIHDIRSFVPGLERLHDREAFNARDAVAAAAASHVKKLVLTHFHFDSTDRELEALVEGLGHDHPFEIDLAREGSTLWL